MRPLTICTGFLALISVLTFDTAHAAPGMINYQAVLTDTEGLPISGVHQLHFAIYPDSSGLSFPLWIETHPDVTVDHGLVNVILGSVTPIAESLFELSERWLGIKVDDDPEIRPRMRFTSVPWALRAAVADSALSSTGAADTDWIITGDDMHAGVPGKVGVGTDAPLAKLHVERQDLMLIPEALLNDDLVVEDSDAGVGIYSLDDGGAGSALSLGEMNAAGEYRNKWSLWRTAGGSSKLRLSFGIDRSYVTNPTYMSWTHTGVSIGSHDPEARLDVQLHSGAGGYHIDEPGLVLRGGVDNLGSQIEVRDHSGNPKFLIDPNGNVDILSQVGIGTTMPDRRFELADDPAIMRLTSSQLFGTSTVELKGVSDGTLCSIGKLSFLDQDDVEVGYMKYNGNSPAGVPLGIALFAGGGGNDVLRIESGGKVGIGTWNPTEKLDVRGTAKCEILVIDGGADLAEPFDVQGGVVEPGMVVSIDPDQPGRLKLAAHAHDRCVAGIVSGAGGLAAGLVMGQRGSEAHGEHPIALTGRVYCRATAANGAIRPGDLLTSADLPGHAMKVTDHVAAQGAIIGKAMSALSEGQGLVLVLVALQ